MNSHSSKEDALSSSVTSIAMLQKHVGEMLPSLSKAEAQVLGLLTYRILMLDGGGITRLSHGLAKIEQVPVEQQRQRWRAFYYEAEARAWKETAGSQGGGIFCRFKRKTKADVYSIHLLL